MRDGTGGCGTGPDARQSKVEDRAPVEYQCEYRWVRATSDPSGRVRAPLHGLTCVFVLVGQSPARQQGLCAERSLT